MSEEEKINQSADDSPQQTENNNTVSEPSIINDQPSIEIMEVHKHPHHVTHKKKWGEYLLEFLMLFLAVFLGFLAENYREHLIDNSKEKEFVKSLLEDLKNDTSRLDYSIRRLNGDIINADSLVLLYEKESKERTYEIRMSTFGQNAGNSVDIVFNDRTSFQLKGTGSMRLIRQKALADSISKYWNNQIKIAQIHDRFEAFRVEQRKIGWKTFNWSRRALHNFDSIRVDNDLMKLNMKYLTSVNNAPIFNEFINATSSLSSTVVWQLLPELETELSLAKNIISLIKKEYHLE